MKPAGSMMKPDPNDVTCWGALLLGPRKFLNKSSSGEPGGRAGMSCGGGAFRVWEVAILTTLGSSLADRSAKESGAPRAKAGAVRTARANSETARRRIKGNSGAWDSAVTIAFPSRRKQGEIGNSPVKARTGWFGARP